MTMSPRMRRFALTAHIAASVGWVGAVASFLGLAVAGLITDDLETARALYVAMESTGRFVLVPFAIASLSTGLAQSLGTPWGLFRHYWVVVKLIIAVVATVILVLYLQTLGHLADLASGATTASADAALRDPSPVLHAAAAMLLLLTATTLAVYKPPGLTPYGWRKQHELRRVRAADRHAPPSR